MLSDGTIGVHRCSKAPGMCVDQPRETCEQQTQTYVPTAEQVKFPPTVVGASVVDACVRHERPINHQNSSSASKRSERPGSGAYLGRTKPKVRFMLVPLPTELKFGAFRAKTNAYGAHRLREGSVVACRTERP